MSKSLDEINKAERVAKAELKAVKKKFKAAKKKVEKITYKWPQCVYDFNVKVWHSDYVDSTPRYSRCEDKPELKECYKKSLNRKIMKVDPDMVKYIKDEHGFRR